MEKCLNDFKIHVTLYGFTCFNDFEVNGDSSRDPYFTCM